jgi:hypothetical protein
MLDRSDINAVDDAAWEQAVAREAVIRRLASTAICGSIGDWRSRLPARFTETCLLISAPLVAVACGLPFAC